MDTTSSPNKLKYYKLFKICNILKREQNIQIKIEMNQQI